MAKASREYKILSRELDIPVLLLSQLSRAVETRADKKPVLSDLRESGSIEQDADTVTFVYRPEYYKEEGYVTYDGYGNFDYGTAFAIVAKQREGATGEVEFCYDRTLTKIWDGERRYAQPARTQGHGMTPAPIVSPFDGAQTANGAPPSVPPPIPPDDGLPFGDYSIEDLPF